MPELLRVLIADDEEPARRLMQRYLRKRRDVEVAAECRDSGDVAAALANGGFDLLLLDIRMPGRNVLDVIEESRSRRELPAIVFTTAYDRYAVKAFELNAVDYLLKPISLERFNQAIEKVRRRSESPAQENLRALLRDLGPRPDRILVPHHNRLVPIAVADILWIKAEADYARIHTREKSYLVSRTLLELEKRLDPAQFLRIHRSAMVRADKIRDVTAEGSSRYRVTLEDGTALIVSRARAPQLKRWML